MHMSAQTGCRQESTLEPLALNRLLQWLDDGVDSHGERFLEMHRRLVSYFDRHNRLVPEELADETFRRIASTIATTNVTATTLPARYCYVIARSVLLEDIHQERTGTHLDGAQLQPVAARLPGSAGPGGRATGGEPPVNHLDRCLTELPAEERQLLVEYYGDARMQGPGHRGRMAERMGISRNTLGVRAFRIRESLMSCVNCSKTLR